MTMLEKPNDKRYLTDAAGNKTDVVLSLEEYEALLDRLDEYADAELLEQRASEESVSWDEVIAGLQANGKL